MTAFARGIYLLAFFYSSVLAIGQSGSPQAALEEMATAQKLETVLRHLPSSVEQNIRQLSPEQRIGIENQLLIQKKMKAEGVELQRGTDGSTWELTAPNNSELVNGSPAQPKKILITIQNAIENGDDAMLIIDGRPQASATPAFAASPLIRHGYEFQYTHISSDRYTITARPLEMGMTPTPRSFFSDESCVIRFTQENRPATAQDPPLQ